jgi:hypothetical protein
MTEILTLWGEVDFYRSGRFLLGNSGGYECFDRLASPDHAEGNSPGGGSARMVTRLASAEVRLGSQADQEITFLPGY